MRFENQSFIRRIQFGMLRPIAWYCRGHYCRCLRERPLVHLRLPLIFRPDRIDLHIALGSWRDLLQSLRYHRVMPLPRGRRIQDVDAS